MYFTSLPSLQPLLTLLNVVRSLAGPRAFRLSYFCPGVGWKGVPNLHSQVCVALNYLPHNPSLWPTNSSVKGREWWVLWRFVATAGKKKHTTLWKTFHARYLLICLWIIHVLVWSLFNFLDDVKIKPVPRETLRSWLGSPLCLFRGPHDLKYLWKY